MTPLHNAVALVGLSGGQLTATTSDGEVIFELGLSAGKHRLAEYAEFFSRAYDVRLDGGTIFVPSPLRVSTIPYGEGAMDTAANPDFRPSSADQAAKRMEAMLTKLVAKSNAQDRKLAAMLAEKERREAEQSEVVEREPAPQPEAVPPSPPAKPEADAK